MIITVKDSTLVRPLQPASTPSTAVWLSNIDLVTPNRYTLYAFFYRRPTIPNPNFCDPEILRQALRRALVHFYPLAGRLKLDREGRTEIDCNGEGVLFVVAESSATFDDLGDFAPSPELRKLIPEVDYSASITAFPLLMLQVTFFNCGGVSIGVGTHHRVVDGIAAFRFIKMWADIARGQLDRVVIEPFLDRTVMRARDPPRPQFSHIEYQRSSPTKATWTEPTTTAMFNITEEQINILKRAAEEDAVSNRDSELTTYEVVAGHAWRCRCISSGAHGDQETRLLIATNGRQRLQPPLPQGYFGNVVFVAMPTAKVNELTSHPLRYAATKIKEATKRMDNDYLRSAVDHLELLPPDKSVVERRPEMYGGANLGITSWVRLPVEEADFGWGPPMFLGPLAVPYEGLAYLVRSPEGGGLSLVITLETKQMKVFKDMFYGVTRNKICDQLYNNIKKKKKMSLL